MNNYILDNLCELKKTRDEIDNNVHYALMSCTYGKNVVCILKLESLNEHDISINVYALNNIKHCKFSNMKKCIYAFICDDIDGLKNFICFLLTRKYHNNKYTISRYDLRNIVKNVNENINLFRF